MVAEIGRQPWIVYGLQRAAHAHSTNVSAGMTLFTLLGFMGLYALLGMFYLVLVLRVIAQGPSAGGAEGHGLVPHDASNSGTEAHA